MKFQNAQADFYIPDGADEQTALCRTTDLCVGAHQDDTEIMAFGPISACYGKPDRWFTDITVTDGAGSPRNGLYGRFTDEEMKTVRLTEQRTAAAVGGYSAQLQLGYSSAQVKDPGNAALIRELAGLIEACAPETLYTHNLADKHDTHVAVALRAIAALRSLPREKRPKKIVSLEVWRGLDWLCDEDKTVLDTGSHPNLAAALLGVFDSQIAGGKRYDDAALGRRLANATFFASHATDNASSLSYGLDITSLANDESLAPEDFIARYVERFRKEITDRIVKLSR